MQVRINGRGTRARPSDGPSSFLSLLQRCKAFQRLRWKEEVGDLVGYSSGAMQSATDVEVARLAAKDD